MGERDQKISLLERLLQHGANTAKYNVYYGEGRDIYDESGRTAHESIFNLKDGSYRCPNSQQGFSPFSTWTRGLAWAILGYAEQLEFLNHSGVKTREIDQFRGQFARAATVTADFYIRHSCADGIPMWDTGAPNLHKLGNYSTRPSDPFNKHEPVDSSAAAIAAQGLIRLGNELSRRGAKQLGNRYRHAGLTVANTLMQAPYLSEDTRHQGLLLHSIYHRPNGWDCIAAGRKVPSGESSMWGDYHLRELALLLLREAKMEHYPMFFASKS
jgi:hypothetical protein